MLSSGAMQREVEMNQSAAITDARDDASLVHAVARKDEAAFAELYRRHERAMCSMACHITMNSSLAEEIVQEAMLRVWRSAPAYRGEGPVRAWIMRIVAHRALALLKRMRRANRKLEEEEMPRAGNDDNASSAAEGMEREELLAALRTQISALPEVDRQLVVLYYSGGLSQLAISTALSIPQQTISRRIENALSRLRLKLREAGFAAALPLANSDGLRDAIQSGHDGLPGLLENVLGRLSETDQDAGSAEELAPARQSAVWKGLAAVGGVCVAVAAAVWMGRVHPAAPPSSIPAAIPASAPKSVPASVAAVAPPAETGFHKRWTFEQESQDLAVVMGDWTWTPKWRSPRGDDVPVMLVGEKWTFVVPKMDIPASPFKLTMTLRGGADRSQRVSIKVMYCDENWVLPFTQWKRELTPFSYEQPHVYELYFVGKDIFYFVDGKLNVIDTAETPYPSRKIGLGFRYWAVEAIELRSLKDEEIPAELRDPEALKAEIKSAPQARQWLGDSVPPEALTK